MKVGSYEISEVTWGTFRLDGGAMFGSVPKNLWSRLISADAENCIPLAARSLLLTGNGRKILVDVGMGEKWSEKSREIFAIRNRPFSEIGIDPDSITDVVLTHLHFDHAGGISKYTDAGAAEPVFKNARIHVQRRNLEEAKNPSVRERASYLKENWSVITESNTTFLSGDCEVLPALYVHEVNGHTKGQQWIEIRSAEEKLFFATDLIPTSRHLPIPYTMGYDMCTETVLREKSLFLERAHRENAVVVFQHDPDLPAARIHLNEKGHYAVREAISL